MMVCCARMVWLCMVLLVVAAPVTLVTAISGAHPFNSWNNNLLQLFDEAKEKVLAGLQQKSNITSSFQSIYIDCGASADYTDSRGHFWKADLQYFTSSGRAYRDCPRTIQNVAVDEALYCTERWFDGEDGSSMGIHGYEIPIPNTSMQQQGYSVTLHFAENFYTKENEREFDVQIEDGPRQTIDIVARAAGPQKAFTLTVLVDDVSDGFLSIRFYVRVEHPTVSAIEIHATVNVDVIPAADNTTSAKVPTYVPGMLTVEQNGLLLSQGLTAKILAVSNSLATYSDGTQSTETVHTDPDAGACFVDYRPGNEGGWIYVSNSEAKAPNDSPNWSVGGVGAFTFNANGDLLDYRRVLINETSANCGGGKTPWGAWISGEEREQGQIWQVDPTGERRAQAIVMSHPNAGLFESFAYDVRQSNQPRFFMSKDDVSGELRRL
jgi:Malectin domain/Bacterial protein of unknown function (DUF839)